MGFGASKIDYKERNFTEEPLDDQEIDILLQALPEENIINSIESEGREKILRAMSDQKVFNIRGDNIFDYYFTNNKEELKSCMTNQFTRDGTPCPDEKFNRMIQNIPDLVQGPLGEKETEWDTEKTNLQSQYNTLNTEKTNLQSQYDTLNEERKQNLDTLALDGFLANPEMYNKMLMEKMSQKSLDIFTKDGDIDINVKEFVEHSSIKSTLERAHKERKTTLYDFIEVFKGQASNLLNGFNKEAADGVKSQMPPLGFLMTLIQMKIAVQYSGSDKTKIAPNRTLYNYFSEFFDELGIGTNNIEYTLKFITFNTFKKFMEYDSKNDVKGINLHLQDFLKLLKEFGGEEYLNSLSNFEIDTDLLSMINDDNYKKSLKELVERTSGPPHKNISKKECYDWAEMKGLENRGDYENSKEIPGCFHYAPNNKVYYNKTGNKNRDCDTLFKCIQKENYKPLFKSFRKNALEDVKEVTTGKPLENLTKQECYQWADMKGLENRGDYENSDEVSGCFLYTNNKVYYNETGDKNRDCDTSFKCIQKPKKYSKKELDVLESEIQKNLLSNVVRVTDGNNTKTVSEQQCKAYAKSLGTTMRKGNDTSGCYLAPVGEKPGYGVFYTKKTGRGKCYYNSDSDYRVCIQNNLNRNNTYSKINCRGDVGGKYDCRVDGTWDQITVKGWDRNKYGQKLDDAKHFCNTHKDCVAVASSSANWNWPVHTTSKFKPCNVKEVSSGKPDMSVSKEECKAYAKSIGKTMFHEPAHSHYALGCTRYFEGSAHYIYWSENPDASHKKCGQGYHRCIQKENNCDPKMNYHTKRTCKKPIDGVWTKGVGESCEWECPGRSGIEKYTVPKFHAGRSYACSARDYTYDKNKKAHSGGGRKLVQGSKGHFSCRSQGGSNFGYKSYKHQDNAITHKSSCSDWDNPAMFYQAVVTETVDIDVGSSTGKTKVVDLPHKNMTVSNKPINKQNPNWPDTFEVSVSGTKLTVTRTDSNDAWGQKLVLRGFKENLPTVSEEECKAYADTHGYTYGVPWVTLKNVWSIGTKKYYKENIDKNRYKTGKYYANDCGSKWMSSDFKDSCSKGFGKVAKTSANAVYGADQNREFSSDKDPKGCFLNDKNVYFNKNTSTNAVCNKNKKCIQKQYYKVAGSGVCDKPEDIVPQNECKQAAKSLGFEYSRLGFGNKGEHAQSGCFMDGNTLFHFDNKWKGDNYKKVGDYGGRTYICKR